MRLEAALLALAFVHGSRLARADASRAAPFALDTEAQTGWVHGEHSGGVGLGGTARIRHRTVTAGLSLQGATTMLGAMGSASAVAGLSVPFAFLRIDALAEVGVNAYAAVGANFLNHDPGASAVLPFVGGRAAMLARILLTERGASVWTGPALQYGTDLHSTKRTYPYREQGQDGISGDEHGHETTRTVPIGQSRFAVLALVSVALPL